MIEDDAGIAKSQLVVKVEKVKQIFVSSMQKEFERARAAIKRMVETDSILKPYFKAFIRDESTHCTRHVLDQIH